MNEKIIWKFFKDKGLTDSGIAGLMGNLYAESGLNPMNLQNTYEHKLGMSDSEYTSAVDNGSYDNFINDSAGYGLAQWTFWSRKRNLLNFCKQKNKSIGDLEAQLEFLYLELTTSYPQVLNILKTSNSIAETAKIVLLQFERPADQSVDMWAKRTLFAQEIYKKVNDMSNSSLISYTKLSPNHSGQRVHSIDTITPHCVVGQCSIESLGNLFAQTSSQSSSNYGIGVDGRIGLFVDEKNRSWCSSNNDNDQRAVTIECASDAYAPYAFNDVVYQRLIDLCVDICKRNGKTKLLWFGDKYRTLNYTPASDEMLLTVHRWFDNKSCPGDWMYARMGNLATSVTQRLNGEEDEDMTQEKFAQMMTQYLADLAEKPADFEQGALDWAVANKLMIGNDKGQLAPKKYITRGEMITVLQRFYNEVLNK